MEKALFLAAKINYLPGQLILDLGQTETFEADPRRIQITDTLFLLPPQLIYHSCEPNAYIDWPHLLLRASRPIAKQALITYHYGTSELDYEVGAFQCECGSRACVGYFRGFMYMLPEQQSVIRDYLSPYIRSALAY
ncbi:MAG: SET domain-containing protein-lysine N-methyltransferase [Patescibacteria group bacterium]